MIGQGGPGGGPRGPRMIAMSISLGEPRIAIIITTIGRPVLLDRLLASLVGQTPGPCQIVVADQSTDPATADVVARWRDRLPVQRVTSARGASAGRNAALAALGDHDVVAFPDDDTIYAPDTIARAMKALAAGPDVVSGRLAAPDGGSAQLSFGAEPGPIDDRTVWTRALTETCFFRARFLRTVGEFDETLGIGCRTPWQSGAETDLLLRGLRAGLTIAYDPDLVVYEENPGDPRPADPAYRAKARHAARGTGRVYRRYYGPVRCASVVVRPLGAALLCAARGRGLDAAWYLHKALGRVEGITGLLLPAPRPIEAQRGEG